MTATPKGNGPTPSKAGLGPQATTTENGERTDGPEHPPGWPRTPDPEFPPPPPPPSAQQEDKRYPMWRRQWRPRARERWACSSGPGHADAPGRGVPLTR